MLFALEDSVPLLPDDGRFYLAPSACLIGKVRLGRDASVWFGAVLRGDNEWITIGARTNVQENAVMHTDPGCPLDVGDNCTIGHGVILHGCVVEDECLIGMGATVMNRARIGRGCLIGAGALVTEGKHFAPGSLIVGNPARVVRALDEATGAALLRSAESYVARAERFKANLRPVG